MPTTPALALPYPSLTDSPDIPFHLQQLAERVEATLSGQPRARIVTGGTPQSIPHNVVTDVTFTGGSAPLATPAGMSDLAGSQLVIPKAGLYIITARLAIASAANGYRALLLQHASAGEYLDHDYRAPVAGTLTTLHIATGPLQLPAGATLRLRAMQTSGAAIAVAAGNGVPAGTLAAHWVGGQ